MREHLYRGRCIFIGKWVFGSLLTTDGACFISEKGKAKGWVDGDVSYSTNWAQVDPSTVGQYTGLPDKKGVRIFEGDILSDGKVEKYVVLWMQGGWYTKYICDECYSCDPDENISCNKPYSQLATYALDLLEVIGNIHDNPELLEVK